MKFTNLFSAGLTSALLLATVSNITIIPEAKANSGEYLTTQLIANQKSTDAANIISEGSFVTVEQEHPTTGKAQIIEQDGQQYLLFDADFTTAQGPDVQIVLHKNNSVPVNLEEGSYVTLAPIQSFNGEQKYLIPDDINLDDYQSVAIWCKQFNVTFGYSYLEKEL